MPDNNRPGKKLPANNQPGTGVPARKALGFNIWDWDGEIDRLPYLGLGVGLFTIKYSLDLFVANVFFHRPWEVWNYIFPGGIDVLSLTLNDRIFYFTLLILALPFIWVGVVLTMRRLRAAQLPVHLVKLFFVPFINVLLFGLLCLLPTQELEPIKLKAGAAPGLPEGAATSMPAEAAKSTEAAMADRPKSFKRPLTGLEDAREDGIYAIAMTVPPAGLLMWFGTVAFQTYGWGLFVGLPFAVGMASAYLFGRKYPRTFGSCLGVSMLATTLLGLTVFFYAWEGIFCIIMASPIAYGLAIMGCWLGYCMQKRQVMPGHQISMMIVLLLFFPALMGAEWVAGREAPVVPVTTRVLINAPQKTVWRFVISFPQLPPPEEPVFKLGIAYPIGAIIRGRGPGAIRQCRFSTGSFIEPIQVWDEPRLLKFGVIAQPEPMREFNFIREIHPAHLHGYLNVKSGQFNLTPVRTASGGEATLLEGITWYQNQMWPNGYWRLWSDFMIESIHMRVLNHVKHLAESRAASKTD
jgi:hypothetical protein